jgi:hypothetical protein
MSGGGEMYEGESQPQQGGVTASSTRGIHNKSDESETRSVHRPEDSIPKEEERGTNPRATNKPMFVCVARKKKKKRVANPI